jgi:sec-independent protein translocase protein TatB
MFDIDSSELILIAVVALVVIGPKDLPRVMRIVGQWVGKARGMARHVRSGFDTMMREAEIDELNKRWESENKAIMDATRYDPAAWTPPIDATDLHLAAPEMPPLATEPPDPPHPEPAHP